MSNVFNWRKRGAECARKSELVGTFTARFCKINILFKFVTYVCRGPSYVTVVKIRVDEGVI